MSGRKKFPLLFAINAVLLLAAGIVVFVKRRVIFQALHNRFIMLTGLFSTMAGILFVLFRAIRFFIRLYP